MRTRIRNTKLVSSTIVAKRNNYAYDSTLILINETKADKAKTALDRILNTK